jgi:predicted P-loop ATPase
VKKLNPIKNYFESLPLWDGNTDYITELAKTVHTDNPEFFEKYLKKWLVGMVACAINPNEINQLVLVLVGKQGCGKTTWIENLLPKDLKDYHYKGIINPENKDTKVSMGEYLIMNMDELSTYNSSKINSFKEMITLTGITERRPYARFTEKINRIASFTATSNDVEILLDLTGNRRFLCNNIIGNVDYNHDVKIDRVMAQAYSLYKNGFKYFNDSKDNEEIELQNQNFMRSNPNKDWLFKVIAKPKDGEGSTKMTATEIYELLKSKNCKSSISCVEIGKILSNHDFESVRINGIKKYKVKVL